MNDKKISVVTVTLNSEKYLEKNIQSVKKQTYKNREHIIIDGESTDRTLEIINNNLSNIDKYISEPDEGIADAMNKGIQLSTGDYLLFLNSDDYLIDEYVLEKVASYINDKSDIYFFKVLFLYEDGRKLISLNHGLGLLTNFKMGSCHQGQIISRKLLLNLGLLDTNLKINFDYDFIYRAYKSGAKYTVYNDIISVMRQVGISSRRDWTGFKNRYDEEKMIHYKHCKQGYMYIIYKIYWLLYIPYRYIRYIMIVVNKTYIKNKTIKALQ